MNTQRIPRFILSTRLVFTAIHRLHLAVTDPSLSGIGEAQEDVSPREARSICLPGLSTLVDKYIAGWQAAAHENPMSDDLLADGKMKSTSSACD